MLTATEIRELAGKLSAESIDACQACHDENIKAGFKDDDDFEENYCVECELVLAINPSDGDWTIDHYQYLTRITGQIILPVPADSEDIIDAFYGAYALDQ